MNNTYIRSEDVIDLVSRMSAETVPGFRGKLISEIQKRSDFSTNKSIIYTHDEASMIVEMFEDVLDKYNIKVPSPEDDEREPDNEAKLYGSVYSNLLDGVEAILIELLGKNRMTVVEYEFSGMV